MSKLVILRGLPASGKSTYTKELLDLGYCCISYDAIHKALFGRYRFEHFRSTVIPAAESMAAILYKERMDVVIDNTNMKQWQVNGWKKLFPGYDVQVKVVHPGLSECLVRNVARTVQRGNMSVPNNVIMDMAKHTDIAAIHEDYLANYHKE